MLFVNEAVEVKYAGQTIRGYAVEVTPTTVKVETSFGTREFPRSEVRGLQFMKA